MRVPIDEQAHVCTVLNLSAPIHALAAFPAGECDEGLLPDLALGSVGVLGVDAGASLAFPEAKYEGEKSTYPAFIATSASSVTGAILKWLCTIVDVD